jgi:hypothetical protein
MGVGVKSAAAGVAMLATIAMGCADGGPFSEKAYRTPVNERSAGEKKYEANDPIPPGYHVEHRVKPMTLAAGVILTAVGTTFVVLFANCESNNHGGEGPYGDVCPLALVPALLTGLPGIPTTVVGALGEHVLVPGNASSIQWTLPGVPPAHHAKLTLVRF